MTYRLHGIFVAIALAVSAGIAQAQEATGDLVPYVDTQLVGFTSTTVTGDAGVLGMMSVCHHEFSASRMCTSEEVMNTVAEFNLPPNTTAWVRPAYRGYGVAQSTGTSTKQTMSTLDASGSSVTVYGVNPAARTQACTGWDSASNVV